MQYKCALTSISLPNILKLMVQISSSLSLKYFPLLPFKFITQSIFWPLKQPQEQPGLLFCLCLGIPEEVGLRTYYMDNDLMATTAVGKTSENWENLVENS